MYNLGFLEVLFPEFSDIKARFCWDYYHRYTVDEHTLLAIRNIERLTLSTAGGDSDSPVDKRFSSLLEESSNPVNITLALLFHDIGKGDGDGDNHSVSGARITEKGLKRLCYRIAQHSDMGYEVIKMFVSEFINTVVYIKPLVDHTKKVMEISEVVGLKGDGFDLNTLYEYKKPVSRGEKGEFKYVNKPHCLEDSDLWDSRVDIPEFWKFEINSLEEDI
jgi:hypothetical protein